MARRWTPQRFMMLRRVRVVVCVIAVTAMAVATFALTTRKAVALNVNGKTTTVTTYAMTVDRLLQEQHIAVRSHDIVKSTSGGTLSDHAVVTVRNAYQTTVNVDGEEIPFWTVADSADQLIGFFKANESKASSITVNIDNVYKQLTGGMVINKKGPVTVIADGKSSQAPNGKLPAASILDSKGITVGKEDKVSVTEQGSQTILRVQRVTHGQETRTKVVPFETQTIVDSSLQPGETAIRQQGENGEIQQVYNVTYVDGVAENETLDSETTTKASVNQIVAVGPAKPAQSDTDGKSDDTSNSDSDSKSDNDQSTSKNKSDTSNDDSNSKSDTKTDGKSDATKDSGTSGTGTKSDSDKKQQQNSQSQNQNNQSNQNSSQNNQQSNNNQSNQNQNNSQNNQNSQNNTSTSGRLWHPSPAQAQAYAAAAAAQRGWTGADWDALVWIWNHESSWMWNAENPSSGAYGIPQALPPDKMGAGYRDDAAVQIDWGLTYIAGRYGSPSQAKQYWLQHNWY